MQNALPPVDAPELNLQAWNRTIQAGRDVPAALAIDMIKQLTGVAIPSTSAQLIVEPVSLADGYSFRMTKVDDALIIQGDRRVTIMDGYNPDFNIPLGARILVHLTWPLEAASLNNVLHTQHLELEFSTEPGCPLLSGREFTWNRMSHNASSLKVYDAQGRLNDGINPPGEEKRDLINDFKAIANYQEPAIPGVIQDV